MAGRWTAGLFVLLLLTMPAFAQGGAGWTSFSDASRGIETELPLGLFAAVPNPDGPSLAFEAVGGAGQLHLYGGSTQGLTLADVEATFTQGADRTVTYRAGDASWFVLSGLYRATASSPALVFYTKVLMSPDQQRFAGFEISYPASEKARFDPIVERLEDGFSRPD